MIYRVSDVRWTRTTVGGPNYLGGSVTISALQRVEGWARWDRSAGGRTLVTGRRRARQTGSSGSRGQLGLDGFAS